MSNTDFLTVAELAEHLGVGVSTVRNWTAEGRIPVRRLGPKLVRFSLDAVVAALEANHAEQQQETAATA